MLNRVILIGRLTRDPELRHTSGGVAVARFTLAVDREFTNKQGEREADFLDIVAWRKLGENCANFISKGSLVAVEGRLQISSYDDSQGIRRKAADIIANNVRFLERPKDNNKSGGVSQAESEKNKDENFGDFGSEISFNQDDVPF